MDGVLNKDSDDLLAPLETDLVFELDMGLAIVPTGVGLVKGLLDPWSV